MNDTSGRSYEEVSLRGAKHSLGNRIGRVVWGLVQASLFRFSPRPLFGWRNLLLRIFGARLDRTARVYPKARVWWPRNLVMADTATIADDVDVYCVDEIRIGKRTTISQYSYLCGATHDYEHREYPLIPKPIVIGDHCWLAADVFVGPGVTIGDDTVVGSRSTVVKDLPAGVVAVGNPARPIRDRKLRLSLEAGNDS